MAMQRAQNDVVQQELQDQERRHAKMNSAKELLCGPTPCAKCRRAPDKLAGCLQHIRELPHHDGAETERGQSGGCGECFSRLCFCLTTRDWTGTDI